MWRLKLRFRKFLTDNQHLFLAASAAATIAVFVVMCKTYKSQQGFNVDQISISKKLAAIEEASVIPYLFPEIDSLHFHFQHDTLFMKYQYRITNSGNSPAHNLRSKFAVTGDRMLEPADLFADSNLGASSALFPHQVSPPIFRESAWPELMLVLPPGRDTTLYSHVGLSYQDEIGNWHLCKFSYFFYMRLDLTSTGYIRVTRGNLGYESSQCKSTQEELFRPDLDSSLIRSLFSDVASGR